MAGVRSSKQNFKNYFRIYNTLCSKTSFTSPARESSKVFNKTVPCYVGRDRVTDQVRCGRELRRGEWVPIKNISNTQEKRKTTTNLRFKTPKLFPQTPEISADKSKTSPQFYARRGLFRKARYQPSLFSYPREKESSKISCVRLRESGLSNDILTFRPVHRTDSIFQCQQVGGKLPERKGSTRSRLLGRFSICKSEPKHTGKSHAVCSRNSTEHGLVCQPRKISVKGHAENRISRNSLEGIDESKITSERQNRTDFKRCRSSSKNKTVVMEIGHGIDRKARVRITCDPSRKTSHQAYAKSGQKTVTRPAGKKKVLVTSQALQECGWWAQNIINPGRIFVPEPTMFVSTDASDDGWGIQVSDHLLSGPWTEDQLKWHINRKELYAVLVALREFREVVLGQSVMVQSDNRTVVSYLRNQGGTKSIALLEMTRKILVLAQSLDATIHSFYLPGRYNSIADCLSRGKVLPDWHIKSEITQKIFRKWGVPQVDLFSSGQSNVVPVYVSIDAKDTQALFVNAFSRTWNFEMAWIFPPPPLIPRVLQHLNKSSGTFLIVVPRWETVFWRSDLKHRALGAPFLILNLKENLIDLSTNLPPPKVENLCLEVWKIRGGRI